MEHSELSKVIENLKSVGYIGETSAYNSYMLGPKSFKVVPLSLEIH